MDDDERALLYEAGYLAGRLQWRDPVVVSASAIASVTPDGGPVIVVGTDESMTVDKAQAVAAVSWAGRPIRLVTAGELPGEVAAWLPEGSIHVIGQEVTTPPATPVIDYLFDSFEGVDSLVHDLDDADKAALAAAMRGVKVGVAWDRHILMPAATGWFRVGGSPNWPIKGLSKAMVDYSDYEFVDIDLLAGLQASLTLNIRILDQVILLVCGPFNWDWRNESYCVTGGTDTKFRWLQEGPLVSVSALGHVPDQFRRVPGGENLVKVILSGWADSFFGVIQRGGEVAFCQIGVGFDTDLQADWDDCVENLEAGVGA